MNAMEETMKTVYCLLAAALLVVPAGCDIGRSPDDTHTNLVGFFDPDTHEGLEEMSALVDFSTTRQYTGTGSINLPVAQAVFARVLLLELPEEGTCQAIAGPWARAGVAETRSRDMGEFVALRTYRDFGIEFVVKMPRTVMDPDHPELYQYIKIGAFFGFFEDEDYELEVICHGDEEGYIVENALETPEIKALDIVSPDYGAGRMIEIDADDPEDLTIEWTPSSERTDYFMIRIFPLTMARQVVCRAHDSDGSFTIPAAMLRTLPAGDTSIMVGRTSEKIFTFEGSKKGVATSSVNVLGMVAIGVDGDDDGFVRIEDGGTDCDDTFPFVNPGEPEDCDNGIDDDCDGLADADDPDCVDE